MAHTILLAISSGVFALFSTSATTVALLCWAGREEFFAQVFFLLAIFYALLAVLPYYL